MPLSSLAHEITQGALTWLPIAFFAILVFLIWRTIQLMPRVKPNLTEPDSEASVSFADVAGVEDAARGLDEERTAACMAAWREGGVEFTTVGEVVAAL